MIVLWSQTGNFKRFSIFACFQRNVDRTFLFESPANIITSLQSNGSQSCTNLLPYNAHSQPQHSSLVQHQISV